MAQRTCTIDGCERKHLARGMCSHHYWQAYERPAGKSHHTYVERTCEACGKTWSTPRSEARFCTAKCKGVHLSELNRKSCKLDAGHPVMALIEAIKRAERDQQQSAQREAARPKFAWRTARECPGCACWFTPVYAPNAVTCSKRCSRRVHRWRRAARERDARGEFTWSEFMRIARKFNYCCAYCGIKPDRLDPDHVVPLSRGGSNTPSNLLPTCNMCNSNKCAMTLDEWADWRAARGQEPRATSWETGDPRYVHLTDALLSISPAA